MAYGFFRELLEMVRISGSHIFVALGGILQNRIDGAPKNNNFQKKFIKKYLFVEDITFFQEQKSRIFPSKSANISMENQWKSNFATSNLH